MGGYVDQGCRNIKFWKDGTHLWLSCECPRDDGTCRTSQIDLNLCIGPESGGGDGLEALGGFKVVTLTYGGGKGNYNDFRDWQLVDDGRTFKCMGEVRPGLSGMLPWNWGKDSEWAWTQFNLNEHLNNVNGVLEFWAKKSVSTLMPYMSEASPGRGIRACADRGGNRNAGSRIGSPTAWRLSPNPSRTRTKPRLSWH
jgi:hypothetical protein